MKVVVIGAGASGIIASLKASENHDVILIDGNDRCGKKILITGNGKCNYWNEYINDKFYNTDNYELLSKILEHKEEVFDYLSSLGIYPIIKNNCYYPASESAQSIREIFEREIIRRNVKTMYNTKVLNIIENDNKFIIETTSGNVICDKVIISTGGAASPKTGSDGSMYEIVKRFGYKINPILPSLVALKTSDNIKDWAGVRARCNIKLFIDDKFVRQDFGEIQLTETGISGICTFNISRDASVGLYNRKKVLVVLNFMPDEDYFYEFMESRNKLLPNRTIEELLESIINYKLMNVIYKKSKISKDSHWNKLSDLEKQRLCDNITSFELLITGTNGFDKAQVSTGGISLKEINEDMSSKYNENIFFTGELLDVDGVCGGYNLAFAFISGYIAGSNI